MADIEDFKREMFNGVLDHGFIVQYIDGEGMLTRAYTVGRTMLGRPEFTVTGLSGDESDELLRKLVEVDDQEVIEPRKGGYRHGDLFCTFHEAEPLTATGAVATFGNVRLLQAVWTDVTGSRTAEQPHLTKNGTMSFDHEEMDNE